MTVQEQLMEFNIQDIIEYIVNDEKTDYEAAMKSFFSSVTFEKLQDLETGLYRESSGYVYDLYCLEKSNGLFIQNEI